ncbi:DUF6701 domain-containing protein [Duganella sp. P38]|uniref:DUF6701 domain-containing protein n=1 Tax=Duganella sp. P38 TaxID=3423949 RepID=UPI003D78B936
MQLKACADASCSSTYTGATTVTLAPGGASVTFNGTGSGSVSQAEATPSGGAGTLLSAVSGAIGNANVCINANNASTPCNMIFRDNGLVLSAPDHVSMKPGVKLNIQALQTSPLGSCVPLVKNASAKVRFSCAYKNPLPANASSEPVRIGGSDVSCGGAGTDINLAFDSNGLATPSLQYAEVGQTSINAAYTSGNLGASGAAQFTTAPATIKVEPVRLSALRAALPNFSSTAFARGSEPFKIKLTALNAAGNPTRNFGRESPDAQTFAVPTPVLTDPTGGNNPVVQGSYKGIANGVADATDDQYGPWRFDETGTLAVTVKLASRSTYYLDNSTEGFNPQTKVDLVFAPDHFDVTLGDALPMSCALVGGMNNPCNPYNSGGKFLYARQPFALVLNAYIGAKDSKGNYIAPKNYVGAAARAITLQPVGAGGGDPATLGAFSWSKEKPGSSRALPSPMTTSPRRPSARCWPRPTCPATISPPGRARR